MEAFDRAKVRNGVLSLVDQAEMPTRKRGRLRTPVFYRVDEGAVLVLRVQFKGSRTIEEMGS